MKLVNFTLFNRTRCIAVRRFFEQTEAVRRTLVALLVALTFIFASIWALTQKNELEPVIAVFVVLITILQGLPAVVATICPHPLMSAVILELSMASHQWKNQFMDLYLGGLGWKANSGIPEDIWDALAASAAEIPYTDDNMMKGRYLTQNTNKIFVDNLVTLADLYGDQFSPDLRLKILSTISRVRFSNSRFPHFEEPWLKIFAEKGLDRRAHFGQHFAELVKYIGELERMVDDLKKQHKQDDQ
ncbi:MAG: hypothetical protein OEZ57_13285 [Nitrospirota bacterium]|nr:hypothetical protein [Nitrospirota bacterium]MDH5587595.1 hypothetical protein [Nitrospirota bacterium]MDH5775873.1 hypothetical protein [Nitrospirota bacterium]